MAKSKKLKVAVIGVGGIANTHMPGWAASEHAECVLGADLAEKPLQNWAEKWDIPKTTTKTDDVFADPEIDIVDVCTPNAYHAPLSIAALEAGKHVICEKPLAPTPDEIRKMIAARDKSGKMLMTAQHFRFAADSKALKAEIDEGALGEIYHARGWWLRRAALPTGQGFILKKHSGGGPCIDIGVHLLDTMLWLMDHPRPVTVSGVAKKELAGQEGAWSVWGGAVPKEMDVEDFAAGFVRFDNDATLSLEVSWMLHHDTEGKFEDRRAWFYGRKAGAEWPACRVLSTNNRTQQWYDQQLGRTSGGMEPHAAECVAFAEAVAEGKPSPVPAEQSLYVQAILDGLYRSQEAGEEIKLDV